MPTHVVVSELHWCKKKLAAVKIDRRHVHTLHAALCDVPSRNNTQRRLKEDILSLCDDRVSIESVRGAMYNVAVAGTIVLYHRHLQHMREAANRARMTEEKGRTA